MRIGYYKSQLKQIIFKKCHNYRLRKNNIIGRHCSINKKAKLEHNVKLGDSVKISNNVFLSKNTIVGSGANLSNILVGENTHIESGVICTGFGNGRIIIGKECYIGINNILDWSANIKIGDFVHIAGPSTGLWTHSSTNMCLNGDALNKKTLKNRPIAPIKIESNVYIGGNCTIYPGVEIGHHSIIAPNSAVTKNVEPYSLLGGVPAKFIKKIEIKK